MPLSPLNVLKKNTEMLLQNQKSLEQVCSTLHSHNKFTSISQFVTFHEIIIPEFCILSFICAFFSAESAIDFLCNILHL
jgi:hypothetical protein